MKHNYVKFMKFLRNHWYDLGIVLGLFGIVLVWLFFNSFSKYELLMWISLITLFFHQAEEYRIVGTFPGMINHKMFKSKLPDRYPLNTNTSLIINVCFGWFLYVLAALFAESTIWLGMATIFVSFGNVMAHVFLFNIKGKTFYNAGMASSVLLFIPCVYYFFEIIITESLVTTKDYIIGIPLGLIINYFGILKPIVCLADKHTTFIFQQRQLLPQDRK